MLLFALPRGRADGQADPIYRASWWDAASVGAAGALFVLPTVLELPKGPPSCAPCDPTTVPTVDRSALHTFSDGAGTASDVVLAGVAGLTAFASLHGLPAAQWRPTPRKRATREGRAAPPRRRAAGGRRADRRA